MRDIAYNFEDHNVGIIRLKLGPFTTNSYIVVCKSSRESILVDAPDNADKILGQLAGTRPKCVVLTHSHVDHIGALGELKSALSIQVAIHPLDADELPYPPDIHLNDGDTLDVGMLRIKVLHTPGHTPGSTCLLVGRQLLAGDTIFPGGPGHTVTPANFKVIVESIESKILVLPDETGIYPGHGDATNVGIEKRAFARFASQPHPPDLCGDVLWLSA
jgi:glyoxylase-like metal-dependent hydrolase (beta-lactamase superfamily II)